MPLQYVRGIGPKRAEQLAAEGIVTFEDVLLNAPHAYVHRGAATSIADISRALKTPVVLETADAGALARVAAEVTIMGTVTSVQERKVGSSAKNMFQVTVADNRGSTAQLIFWNMISYYKRLCSIGSIVVVSGKPEVDLRWSHVQFHHPDVERVEEQDLAEYQRGAILPKYTITQGMRNAGITMRTLRMLALHVLDVVLPVLVDPLPESIRERLGLVAKDIALRELHSPTSLDSLVLAQKRMKFEELFFFELLLAAKATSAKRPERGIQFGPKSPRARRLVESLPFQLTRAQRRVIHEIVDDCTNGSPMNRLLQGDVGSGKTVVAVLSMLQAVDNGCQALLMAPTEILAEQHYRSIQRLVHGLDVEVVQLIGGQRKKVRAEIASKIATGEAHIIVGTHALFEAAIEYCKLGLIVIDEQHRFGVAQRAELRKMGVASFPDGPKTPHILVMSATPIPRTLSMTVYGDLDVSMIDELPANRKPIRTHIVFESKLHETYQFIEQQIDAGRQAYVVFPLVEKSEKLDLKSAVEHYEFLQQEIFPNRRVGLLHGQMLWYEKEDAMKSFLDKQFDVLVATTVIEVGIDVPNATVMLVHNAERFGLSQLHQLRGRVGRGAEQSYCFLATKDHFQYAMKSKAGLETAAASVIRLRTMEQTTDGFRISEVDLQLRGPGDVLGTRQSGLPEFRFTNLVHDAPMIAMARTEAFALLKSDPRLNLPQHARLRERLIALFEGSAQWMSIA